jgi:hypothetical protein
MTDMNASTKGMGSTYNENSQIQFQAFQHYWPWLAAALKDGMGILPFAQSKLISYADYGCSGGGNALKQFQCLKALLEDIQVFGGVICHPHHMLAGKGCPPGFDSFDLWREQDTAAQLQVLLVDVPSNNWNLVAETLFSSNSPGNAEAILPSMVPKSFYAGMNSQATPACTSSADVRLFD